MQSGADGLTPAFIMDAQSLTHDAARGVDRMVFVYALYVTSVWVGGAGWHVVMS